MDAREDEKLNDRMGSPEVERDKSPEREEDKQERVREKLEKAINETGIKENSRDSMIVGRVIDSIERDKEKPIELRDIQERCLNDLLRENLDKSPDKDVSVYKNIDISDAIRDLKEESFNMALKEVIGGIERGDEAKNNAFELISFINSDERSISLQEKTASCIEITEMLKDGRIPEKEITADEKRDIYEKVRTDIDGRNIEISERNDGRNEKELNDRQRLERAGALEREIAHNAERDKNPLSIEERYRIGSALEKIERNQFADDKFKAAQERIISAYIKEDREIVSKDSNKDAINEIIRYSEKEAFRMEMEQCRDEGKISKETAKKLFSSYAADDKRSDIDRSAYMKAAIDAARSGELKELSSKDDDKIREAVDRNEKEVMNRHESDRSFITTLKDQMNQILDFSKNEIPKLKDEKNQPIKYDEKEIEKAFEDIRRSNEKDFIKSDATKNMQAVQLRMEISMNPQRFVVDGKFSPEELLKAYSETERSVFTFRVEHSDLSREQKDNANAILRSISDNENLRSDRKSAAYELLIESVNRKDIPDSKLGIKDTKEIENRLVSDSISRIRAVKNASPYPEYEKRPGEISRFYASNKALNLGDEKLNELRDSVVRHNVKASGLQIDFVRNQNDAIKQVIEERTKDGKDLRADDIVKETKIAAFDKFIKDNEKNYKGENGALTADFARALIREPEKYGLDREEKVNAALSQLMSFYKGNVSFTADKDGDKSKNTMSLNDVLKESRNYINATAKNADARDKSILERTDKQLKNANSLYQDGKEREVKKENGPQKDDRREEKKKEERPIGVDPDKDARDESKISKRTSGKEAKEVYEQCNEIYERKILRATHHTDQSLSHQERDTVERGIKLKNELMDRNNEEIARLSKQNVELQKAGSPVPKETIERLGKLERFNKVIKSDIEKLNTILHPELLYRENLQRPAGETRTQLKKDLIENTIYPDPSNGKIFHFRERVERWRNHEDVMQKAVYDSCLYSAMTGRSPSIIAREMIFASEMKKVNVPTEAYNKLFVESRHHEGVRRYLELFKVENRKVKPLEVNNICNALDMVNRGDGDEKLKEYERLVIADMCRKSQIPNAKMTKKDSEALYEKIQALAVEKSRIKEPIKEGLEREEKKAMLRERLSAVPEKTDREIVKLIISSKEKLDIQGLIEISKDANKKLEEMAVTDKDGSKKATPMEEYTLSKNELRQIVCGKNPEALSKLLQLNVKMPQGVELNISEYDRAVEVIRDTNEKNDVMKMAMVNHALSNDGSYSGLDGAESIRMKSVLEKTEELVKSDERAEIKREDIKEIRQELKEKTREQLNDAREEEMKKTKPFNYSNEPKRVLSQASKYIGNECRSEDYDRQRVIGKLEEIREGMKAQRAVYDEDFKSIHTRDRGLKPADAISVIQNDPRILMNIQRTGISIGRNGLMNEYRLQNAIFKMEEIPKDEVVLRVAVLEKNYISHKNNGMKITNPLDMGDSRDTKDAKNLAFYLYARDHNLKFRQPEDEREKAALARNIETIEKYEKAADAEREITLKMNSMLTQKEIDDPKTFADVNSNMSKLLCLATLPNYEERLKNIVAELKKENSDESSEVGKSIAIMDRLSVMTTQRMSDTKNERAVFNTSMNEKHEHLDFNIGDRMKAILIMEKMNFVNNDARNFIEAFRNSSTDRSSYNYVIDKFNYEKLMPIDAMPTEAEARLMGKILKHHTDADFVDGMYSRPADVSIIPRDENNQSLFDKNYIEYIDYLFDIGADKDYLIERDGDMVYSGEKYNTIMKAAKGYMSSVEHIRSNYSNGKLSIDEQKSHFEAVDLLQKQAERGRMPKPIDMDEKSIDERDKPKPFYDIDLKNKEPYKEQTLASFSLYKPEEIMPQLAYTSYKDKLDAVRPPCTTLPFSISAGDLKTIMDNRDTLIQHGVHYEAVYSSDFKTPTLKLSGLTTSSVSSLTEELYRAITRSCDENDFKEISAMRHNDDIYKIANSAATAYEKYKGEFPQPVRDDEAHESIQMNIDKCSDYIRDISYARDEVFASKDISEEEKINLYAEIEFSRKEMFKAAGDAVVTEALTNFYNEFGPDRSITPEFDSYGYLLMNEEGREQNDESQSFTTIMEDSVKDICDKLEIPLNGLTYSIIDAALNNGKLTEEEYNRAYAYRDYIEKLEELERQGASPYATNDNSYNSIDPSYDERNYAQNIPETQPENNTYQEEYGDAWNGSRDNNSSVSDWQSKLEEMRAMISNPDVINQDQMGETFIEKEQSGCAFVEDDYEALYSQQSEGYDYDDVPDDVIRSHMEASDIIKESY